MQNKFTPPNPPIQAPPGSIHRRQMIWQVWVPLVASVLVVLALGILAIIGAVQGSSQVERWANISAVLVIIPVLISSLVTLLIVSAIAYGVFWLVKRMPGWMLKLQLFMIHFALTVRRAADSATKPVVAVNTFTTRVRTFWDTLFRRKTAH